MAVLHAATLVYVFELTHPVGVQVDGTETYTLAEVLAGAVVVNAAVVLVLHVTADVFEGVAEVVVA